MTRHTQQHARAPRITPLTWVLANLAVGLAIVGWLAGPTGQAGPLTAAAILGMLTAVLAQDDCARARRQQ
jgi:hypothetical protein